MFTLPDTVEEAVGYGLVRVLVGSGNPDDCVLSKKSDDDYSFETVVSYCTTRDNEQVTELHGEVYNLS